MSGVQSDETQKNGTQYCVLQTHLPFTSLPAVALSVYSRSGSSCAQHEHQSLHMYKECRLAVRLVLVVVGAVVAMHGCLIFTLVFFTYKSGLLYTL